MMSVSVWFISLYISCMSQIKFSTDLLGDAAMAGGVGSGVAKYPPKRTQDVTGASVDMEFLKIPFTITDSSKNSDCGGGKCMNTLSIFM